MESPERDFGEKIGRKQNGPRMNRRGPPGGLFGIDQEVVTLRGLYGYSGFLTNLRQAESILNHRKYAGCSPEHSYCEFRAQSPA